VIYAGIDEAGYGPLLGPLVVARAVFGIDEPDDAGAALHSADPFGLRHRLTGIVTETASETTADSVVVNDSKLLYTPATGLRVLERGVLGLLPGDLPTGLPALLELVALDEGSQALSLPWYTEWPGDAPEIPAELPREELEALRPHIATALGPLGVSVEEVRAAVVFEDRFNELVGRTSNKALCSWGFVARHLRELWRDHGAATLRIFVDRQGGRRSYGGLLVQEFPGARIETRAETAAFSRYLVESGGRSMEVSFQVEADRAHLPVALAAMNAKYLRELLMRRFQHFWLVRAPEVKPTAGYYGDGRRFIRELLPLLPALGIDAAGLIRLR
jgi:hypothetical protein